MRATSSLPVPDSPEMCTGAWLRATRRIISRRRSIDGRAADELRAGARGGAGVRTSARA